MVTNEKRKTFRVCSSRGYAVSLCQRVNMRGCRSSSALYCRLRQKGHEISQSCVILGILSRLHPCPHAHYHLCRSLSNTSISECCKESLTSVCVRACERASKRVCMRVCVYVFKSQKCEHSHSLWQFKSIKTLVIIANECQVSFCCCKSLLQ